MARGGLSYRQNRSRPAIEAYQHAIRLSPLDPLGYRFTCGLAFSHTIAGQYEEALLWVDRSLHEQPRFRAAINLKVILYALLGRMEEARQSLDQLRESGYGLTVASYREFLASIKLTPEIVELYIDALRKAGLPEA
jgi:tetratricopeptide (TPR) repeat protein